MNDDPAKAKRQTMMVARGVVSPDERKENLSAFQKGNHPDVPSVVYHGTADDISQFQHNHPNKKDAGWLGKGFYFTNNKSLANSYSMLKTGLSENVMPVHLSLKNPFIATMGHKNAIKQKLFSGDQFAPSDFTNDLISRGHDGVILDYGDKDNAKEYVVFHPTQIKSAIGNQGTFDPNDPDITKARGGMIDDNDKAIRRATMVAKGLAKEIGPLPTGDHPKPPHPASMIPGVHVTGMGDGPQTFADGGDVTSNPNFSQWFGNSVTHDNGVPRTYYTGTSKDKDFTSFNVGRHGAWFTTDPHEASQYAESNDSQGHVWENGRFQPTNTAGRVIPAYLKAENPYTGERPEAINRAQNYKKAQSDWFDTLRAAGHDSWIPSSLKGNLAVMLRHPTQIKSAIGNSGAFDPKQKAIHKADGGDVEPTDETGFDAYHGSPHEFAPEPGAPLGRFRSDKIGTGEGAQAFGHGMYLGEEPTAQRYKNTLRHRSVDPEYMSGVRSALSSLDQQKQQNYDDALLSALTSNNQAALPKAPMGPDALPNLQAAARIFSAHDTTDHPIKVAQQIQAQFPHLRDEGSFLENGPKRLAIADQVEKMRERTKGHLYHVRVNANPEHFLDWDKPLGEQHPHVQQALSFLGLNPQDEGHPSRPGEAAYRAAVFQHGKDPAKAAAALQAAGIPGIRYLDANSRDPNTEKPTHNHVVFDPSKITIKRRYARGGVVKKFAGGGDTGTGMNNDPMVQKALDVAQQATSGMPSQQFSQLSKPPLITGPDQALTTQKLANIFTDAINTHTAMPLAQRALNSKKMGDRIAAFVGRGEGGRPKPLLGQNAKLIKASAGYEAGQGYEAQEPLLLPDGRGVETTGLSLYPDAQAGKFKLCPNSASCRDSCLGKYSGHFAAQYTNKPNYAVINLKNKTKAFFEDPEAFAVRLHDEITQAKMQAAMNGNKLGVRLNTLSDVDPRVHKSIIEAHPDVDFYDYTKMNYDPIAPNHHYTYSSSGVTQPAGYNGSQETVFNPHSNWKQMRKRLDTGSNVAMVFNHRSQQGIPLPKFVHDEETGKKYRVIDGTTHDYRPLDKQEDGADGVIIGLQNLKNTGSTEEAHKDSNGFVVKYDPKLKMVLNAKGKPTKEAMRGDSPGVDASGKPLLGPRIAQNDTVVIAPQSIKRQ